MVKEIKDMWKKEGWDYEKENDLEGFVITFKVSENLTRYVKVFFDNKSERKYYFFEVYETVNGSNYKIQENLFIEPFLHELVHKTLIKLKWIGE